MPATYKYKVITQNSSEFFDAPENSLLLVSARARLNSDKYTTLNFISNSILGIDDSFYPIVDTKNIYWNHRSKPEDSLYTYFKNNPNTYSPLVPSKINFSKFSYPVELTVGVESSYSLSDVIQTLSPNNVDQVSPYPKSVRYLDNDYFVIERPPFKIPVDFKPGVASRSLKPLPDCEMWIPWTITIISKSNFHDVRMFFSDKPLESFDSLYICPITPNSYTNGSICFSNSLTQLNIDLSNSDISTIYPAIISEYFSGGWNLDLGLFMSNQSYYIDRSFRHSSSPDQYPTLYNFVNPTFSYLKDRFPSAKDNEILTMIRNSNSSSASSYSKYFFKILSTFNLSETLSLYSELITLFSNTHYSSHSVYTFGKLIGNSDRTNYSQNYYSRSVLSLSSNYYSLTNKKVDLVMLNTDPNPDWTSSSRYTFPNHITNIYNYIDSPDFERIIHNIVSQLSYIPESSAFFVDIYTGKIELFNYPHDSFSQFYQDFLLSSLTHELESLNDSSI